MRAETWVLVGLLFWITLCCMAAAIGRARALAKELARAQDAARAEHDRLILMRAERDTVMARDEAKRSHACLLRDEEISRLESEIAGWQKKYRTLELLLNRMWEERK